VQKNDQNFQYNTIPTAQARQLADSEEATAALREQLASLKDALRSMAAEKEAADVAATQVNQMS